MKKFVFTIILLVLLLLSLACATYDDVVHPPTTTPTATLLRSATPTITTTPTNTYIAIETFTPLPTETPVPTETSLPTPTPTPAGSGSGKILYWLAEENQTGDTSLDNAFWSVWEFDLNTGLRNVLLESDGETTSYLVSSVRPDGKVFYFAELTFIETDGGYIGESLLYSYNLALGGIEQLSIIPEYAEDNTTSLDLLYESWPDISEDGLNLIFQSNREHLAADEYTEALYLMNLEDGGILPVGDGSAFPLRARFSPDGGKIAYTAWDGTDWEIYVYYLNGTSKVQITDNNASDRYPEWSPGGTSLVYHSDRDGNFDLYVYDLVYGETTQLTNDNGDDVTGSYSPDGTHILFVSDRDENYDIYTYNLETEDIELILDLGTEIGVPLWVP